MSFEYGNPSRDRTNNRGMCSHLGVRLSTPTISRLVVVEGFASSGAAIRLSHYDTGSQLLVKLPARRVARDRFQPH